MVEGCGVLEAHSTSSELSSRYTRQESHSMNSTIRETMPCSTSCKLISRTIRRLIFWKSRSCCSVRSSLDSISLTFGTCLIIDCRWGYSLRANLGNCQEWAEWAKLDLILTIECM